MNIHPWPLSHLYHNTLFNKIVKANNKEIIKAILALNGESTGDQWIPLTNGH